MLLIECEQSLRASLTAIYVLICNSDLELKSEFLENCHWRSHLLSKFWEVQSSIDRHFAKDDLILLKQVSMEA